MQHGKHAHRVSSPTLAWQVDPNRKQSSGPELAGALDSDPDIYVPEIEEIVADARCAIGHDVPICQMGAVEISFFSAGSDGTATTACTCLLDRIAR